MTPSKRNKTITVSTEELQAFTDYRTPSKPLSLPEISDSLWFGDTHTILPLMPESSVDLVIADPPYLLNKNFGQGTLHMTTREAYAAWAEPWIIACARILKPTGTIYICTDWKISGIIQDLLEKHFLIKNRITWKRDKGRGALNNWKNNAEDIWFATKSDTFTFNINDVKIKKEVIAPYVDASGVAKDWFEEDGKKYRYTYPANIWTDLTVPFWSMPENTEHPTQKPEKLIERLIIASSNPGDLVCDPFMGSGTTAVVAKRLNRHYCGCEIEKKYYCLASKRLQLN